MTGSPGLRRTNHIMTDYFDIWFTPPHIKGRFSKDTPVSDAAEQLGAPLRSDCGGKGSCGKCRIIVDRPGNLSAPTPAEEKALSGLPGAGGQRLACQAKIQGPVAVTIPDPLPLSYTPKGKTELAASFSFQPASGHTGSTSMGIAVDIGTTTIAVYLCDLSTGRISGAQSTMNPQRRFGEDVISRISMASRDESAVRTLQQAAVAAVNQLIESCLDAADVPASRIGQMTVVGNTTMQHLFCGLPVKSLGVSPYAPVTLDAALLQAGDLGLALPSRVPVYVFPVISGFLGGDILSAALADQPNRNDASTLIIDIGTNGELILFDKNSVWATSCATGPALEGAQISCGMNALPGAVSRVSHLPAEKFPLEISTIDDKPPIGICGSGIIDAAAVMRQAGILLEDGRFNPSAPGVVTDSDGIGRAFAFPDTPVQITLKDVRQVQLAKAALLVGIESLVEAAGLETTDRTILTGAFGAWFSWENARDIGMLSPKICRNHVISAANLAGAGAVMALVDPGMRTQVEILARRVRFLDLAASPDFVTRFARATRFPPLSLQAV